MFNVLSYPRSEMASERRQAAEIQARLSASVQEKLKAECERGRLALDLQHVQEQLEWHQEELASAKEALSSHRGADGCVESNILPGETSDYENLEEVIMIQVSTVFGFFHPWHWILPNELTWI